MTKEREYAISDCLSPKEFYKDFLCLYQPSLQDCQFRLELLRLISQSMNCILGTMRCRDNVSLLAAACFNTNIPLHMIEFLFQQGADPNATLNVNGRPVHILADLEENLSAERFAAIRV